jgi:hypothetical protein
MLSTGTQIGKYMLGKKLGQGGFGVVFRAHDASLDREVALKFLNEEHSSQPQILQRFLQEARSAAKIAHPGIVTVYECGQLAEANNTAYIAMELLDGESLTDRLARSGRMPVEQAVEIARQVASALEAAHRSGIIHRDLKPDNIFLVRDPAVANGERVKVLDFGIAKLGQNGHSSDQARIQTQSMMVFGTPRYLSPEQCKSAAHVDFRSDIYTLGCILFELVTGRPPFAGAPGELVAQHVLVAAPSILSIVPDAPPALAHLVAAMLAKEPDDRPATMAAVQRQFETVGAVSPGVAPTLLPGMMPPAPSGHLYARPVSASPTTLGGAASSSVVGPNTGVPARSRRVWLVGLAGSAVAVGVVVALVLGGLGSDSKSEQVLAAAPIDAPPAPPAVSAKPSEPVKPAVTLEEPPKVEPKQIEKPEKPTTVGKRPPPKPKTVPKADDGTLTITSKPGCEIVIDGGASFHTPIRGFKIAAGRHKITLVNTDHGISESFVIDIKPGEAEVVSRDYTDRIKPKVEPPKAEPPKTDGKDKTINPFAKKSS